MQSQGKIIDDEEAQIKTSVGVGVRGRKPFFTGQTIRTFSDNKCVLNCCQSQFRKCLRRIISALPVTFPPCRCGNNNLCNNNNCLSVYENNEKIHIYVTKWFTKSSTQNTKSLKSGLGFPGSKKLKMLIEIKRIFFHFFFPKKPMIKIYKVVNGLITKIVWFIWLNILFQLASHAVNMQPDFNASFVQTLIVQLD